MAPKLAHATQPRNDLAGVRSAVVALAARVGLKVVFARGTGDHTADAAAATVIALSSRIEERLRAAPHTLDELVAALDVPAGRVSTTLREYKRKGKIYNVGTEDRPSWVWIVGDECEPAQLRAAVTMLLRERPFAFSELMVATGARRGRVSGVIVAMQREGKPPLYIGDEHKGRWFLPPVKPRKRTRGTKR